MRHFTRLSTWNYGVDTGMYPLGSCTMKYNPKVNEAAARMAGFAGLHPLTPDEAAQGALGVMHALAQMLAEITGLPAVTLQPAAGAHGELTGMMMIRKHLITRDGNPAQGRADPRLRARHEPRERALLRLRGARDQVVRPRQPVGLRARRGDDRRRRGADADQPEHARDVRGRDLRGRRASSTPRAAWSTATART